MNPISRWWRKKLHEYKTTWRLIPKTSILLHGVGILAMIFIAGTAFLPEHPVCAGGMYLVLFAALAILTFLASDKGYTIDGRK